MDLTLFYFVHGFAGLSAWGDALIVFFAETYLYVVLLVFVFAALRAYMRTRQMFSIINYGIALAAAIVARLGVTEVIRHFYHNDRPYTAIAGLSHLINDTASSFPSGHTIFIFALAAAAHFFNKKLAYFLYAS